ncbi:MAG: hypothetical protein QGG40_22185, partial [Myxococcota bacterium]|nr:hypothetical protein [Myxococcota bacterium]
MMVQRLIAAAHVAVLLLAVGACSPEPPRPLGPGEPPNIITLVIDGLDPVSSSDLGQVRDLQQQGLSFEQAFASSDDPGINHFSLLASSWPGIGRADVSGGAERHPNTLAQVLGLYGYRSGAWLGAGFPGDEAWLTEPFDTAEITSTGRCLSTVLPEAMTWWDRKKPEPFLGYLHAHDLGGAVGCSLDQALE